MNLKFLRLVFQDTRCIQAFDKITLRFSNTLISFTEVEALKASYWEMGEDIRLREDIRFCKTMWGRWILTKTFLINNILYNDLQNKTDSELNIEDTLQAYSIKIKRQCVFCPADNRFEFNKGKIKLSPRERTKIPKRRNLSNKDKLTERANKIQEKADRFFNAQPLAPEDINKDQNEQWKSRLVCIEAEAGGLCIETNTLEWLPSFAKTLSVATGNHKPVNIIASNLRNRAWKTPVPPSTEPYCWTAPGKEEILNDELADYNLHGLEAGQCKLFRVNAAGIGEPIIGNNISSGQNYRIIIPPENKMDILFGDISILQGGWKLLTKTKKKLTDKDFLGCSGFSESKKNDIIEVERSRGK
jgi:hypothetical protein